MRNFWIKAKIDGRTTLLEGGPQSKDGGFELTIYVNDGGTSVRAIRVVGNASHERGDDTLTVVADRERPFRDGHDDPLLVVRADRKTARRKNDDA